MRKQNMVASSGKSVVWSKEMMCGALARETGVPDNVVKAVEAPESEPSDLGDEGDSRCACCVPV